MAAAHPSHRQIADDARVIEGQTNGRCYSEQEDGTECDWGTVLVWEPPTRLVLAWQVTHEWQYEPDLDKSSEVEIRFTAVEGGTRIDLEHRHFERHGEGAQTLRDAVGSEGGWGTLLGRYAAAADRIGLIFSYRLISYRLIGRS